MSTGLASSWAVIHVNLQNTRGWYFHPIFLHPTKQNTEGSRFSLFTVAVLAVSELLSVRGVRDTAV